MNNTLVAVLGVIGGALLSGIAAIVMHFIENYSRRKHEILQERRNALFSALHVIDNTMANTSFFEHPPLNPKEWDISEARDAMNKMLVFCKNPKKTVNDFRYALGLHTFGTDQNEVEERGKNLFKSLEEFRIDVAKELGTNAPNFVDEKFVWIYSLNGTKEQKELKRIQESKTHR